MTTRHYPAIDCVWPGPPGDDEVDRLIALVDDFEPTAIEPIAGGVRIFFPSTPQQAAAHAHVAASVPELALTSLLVPDEQWAERSQASLTPIRVGRIVVAPPWLGDARSPASVADDIVIAVQPSMGFGTGHHQSTRLCLALLQRRPLDGLSVIDVGTGSGVLAVAAVKLGAASALGIDVDPDAVDAAIDTVARNDAAARVTMRVIDITRTPPIGSFDLLLGNLTGAMLCRVATRLVAEVVRGGTLIVSGFDLDERDAVLAAFADACAAPIDEAIEDRWIALALRRG